MKQEPKKSNDPYRILPRHTKAELDALRQAIEANGLDVPIIMDTHGNIIDGHARRDVCEELGIDWYRSADVRKGLSPDECKVMAIEVNLARRSVAPTQKQRREYARTLLIANPSRSDQVIADVVGVSRSSVQSYRTELANSGKLKPVLATVGVDGKTRKVNHKNPTRLFVKSKAEYEKCAPLLEESESANGLIRHPDRMCKQVAQQRAAISVAAAGEIVLPSTIQVEHCDFRNLKVKPGSVDLICTDVLWSKDNVSHWTDLAALAKDWLKSDGLFVSFIGQWVLPDFLTAVGKHLHYQWTASVVFSQTNRNQIVQVMERWRPVVIFAKSEKRPLGFIADVIDGGGGEKTFHPYQQSLSVVSQLVSKLSKKGDLIMDPCLGSGTTAVACRDLSRNFIGCDIDGEAVKSARYRVAEDGKKAG